MIEVHWKSGSYPESVATFSHASPAPIELISTAKLAEASANVWRISLLEENHKNVGSTSRARFEHYKGIITVEAALSVG